MAGMELLGSSDISYPDRVCNLYNEVVITVATSTSLVTMFTAPQGYFICNFYYTVDATATISVAGMVTLAFSDSINGILLGNRIYLPVTGFTPAGGPQITAFQTTYGFYRSGKSPGATISVSLSTGLTAGTIRAGVTYGLTNILG